MERKGYSRVAFFPPSLLYKRHERFKDRDGEEGGKGGTFN